jgi:hypothetical protein
MALLGVVFFSKSAFVDSFRDFRRFVWGSRVV